MDKIEEFLKVESDSGYGYGSGSGSDSGYGYGSGSGDGHGYGYGSGDGSGSGSGHGSGYGYGSGDGSGSGSGHGSGDGHGYGYGYGLKSINSKKIVMIDNVQTGITNIKGNVARGFILNDDLTQTPCFIVKQNDKFAHGETLRKAMEAMTEKLFDDMSEEERIYKFINHFNDLEKEYPCSEFYKWHHILTGSCDMGRKSFADNHNIDIKKDTMTVESFIKLTENSYNGRVIKNLKKELNL